MKNKLLVTLLVMVLLVVAAAEEAWADEQVYVSQFLERNAVGAELSEIECLALNIYHEARGESLIGQQYVAQVTMNRVRSNRFIADTVCEVVFQRRQFSWTHDGLPDWALDDDAWYLAYMIAIDFYHLKEKVSDDYADGYLWYYNPHKVRKDPVWAEGKLVRKVGNHLFLYRG